MQKKHEQMNYNDFYARIRRELSLYSGKIIRNEERRLRRQAGEQGVDADEPIPPTPEVNHTNLSARLQTSCMPCSLAQKRRA
eukprot:3357810-Amphidinium_carterae.2